MSTVRVQVLAALLISLLVSTSGGSARAQTQMNNVIRLRSGVEYIGHALLDTTTNTVHVRFRTGGAVTFPLDSVVSVSTYEEVREAPLRLIFDSANLRTCESGLELQLFGVLRLECSATSFVLIC